MLEIRNLCCGYGGLDVLRGINLTVKAGEFFCIAGSNGCGKSTLLKAIARLLPFRGSVTLHSRNTDAITGKETAAFSRKELARHIALLGQVSPLYFPYTVYETVTMGRYAHSKGWSGGPETKDRVVVEETLNTLGLADLRNRSISELSGGQLQRVFLARTLAQEPRIILLDEPTNHLDLKHQLGLLDYLAEWVSGKQTSLTDRSVIAVLHDLNLARRYSKSAALMAEGQIAASGPGAEVFSGRPLQEVYGMDVARFMRESLEEWK
ncbi:iron ABC transporter [Spirochaetia bacterium]|nr:iron ABC transporter [Spirochaetia bacterium]